MECLPGRPPLRRSASRLRLTGPSYIRSETGSNRFSDPVSRGRPPVSASRIPWGNEDFRRRSEHGQIGASRSGRPLWGRQVGVRYGSAHLVRGGWRERRMYPFLTVAGGRSSSAEHLVVAATMAPAVHAVQAWRFRPSGDGIEVRADPARFQAMDDPHGRGLHLGCGAALVNLRLAAAQLGLGTVVRLLPERDDPTLLAHVRLTRAHRTSRAERLLYAATMRPAPGRPRGVAVLPSAPFLNGLAEAARLEGATLHLLSMGTGDIIRRGVLSTRGDGPGSWVRAGQALQRVLLDASVRSASVSFMYEVVDGQELRPMLTPGDVPQVVLELSGPGPRARACGGSARARTTAVPDAGRVAR